MTKKNQHNEDPDIQYEDEFIEEDGLNNKIKKLRQELKDAKTQSQEYLTGWQKERASFANFKAEEEKKRQERITLMKTNLISDFFPVLDSFEMAFGNKETWEKVDANWRTGIEYIHTQLMNTLESYGVSVIDQTHVPFDPHIHDPVENISVDDESQDAMVLKVLQKGYQAGSQVLRPAKVHVGKYQS